MSYSTEEKDWLRRISNRQSGTDPHAEKQETRPIANKPKVQNKAKKKGRGFKDIAGMENLKQMVIENFINVLQNSELAKAYGIRPPSILFMALQVVERLSLLKKWLKRLVYIL